MVVGDVGSSQCLSACPRIFCARSHKCVICGSRYGGRSRCVGGGGCLVGFVGL